MKMASTENLIELVRKYPILYDLSHGEYKNIRKKDKIWNEIGAELTASGEETKKKWKNVRDTFVRYIRINRTRTGQAAKHLKKWQWAEQMEVFRPFLNVTKTSSNISKLPATDKPATADDSSIEDVENEECQSELNNSEVPEAEEVTRCVTQSTDSNLVSERVTQITGSRKRKTKCSGNEKKKCSADAIVKYLENKKNTEKDTSDLLFSSYSSIIKNFSGKRQADTKLQIAQIIAQQEILHHEEQSLITSYEMPRPSTSSSYASESSFYASSPLISPISYSESRISNESITDCGKNVQPEEQSTANYSGALKRLVPLFDRVLIQKAEAVTKTKGGIVIPEKAQGKILHGTVVAVGPGQRKDDGTHIPVAVKVGEKVLLPEYGGTKVEVDENVEYHLYRETDILAKVDS